MGKILDISGQRFGKLVAQYPIQKNGRVGWHCKCDCGNECDVDGANLRGGKQVSCGCAKKEGRNAKDISGQHFGYLTAIEPTKDRQGGSIVWKCQCDCGNITYVTSGNLRSGHTKSCGCQKSNLISKTKHKDLTGQRFGKLVALEYIPGAKDKKSKWKCQCDCGNICYIPRDCLTREQYTTSCGCSKSRGEVIISNLLRDNKIEFEIQKSFSDFHYPYTYASGHFDFFIEKEYLLEYDGEQHYIGWQNDEDSLLINQERDAFKNKWCLEHHIPLVRIPYWELKDLTIEKIQQKKQEAIKWLEEEMPREQL